MVLISTGGTEFRPTVGTSPFMLLVQYDFIAARGRDFTCSSHSKAHIKKRLDKSQSRKHLHW